MSNRVDKKRAEGARDRAETLSGFLKRLRGESPTDSEGRDRVADSLQGLLDGFQRPSPEEERPRVQTASLERIEGNVDAELGAFQSYVRQIREVCLKLEEIAKLFKSGEVKEDVYTLIKDELAVELSLSADGMFKSRQEMVLDRARAKLEWAKEKIGLSATIDARERIESHVRPLTSQRMYPSSLRRWEELASRLDAALSTLPIEEETATIEKYLTLIKERLSLNAAPEETARRLSVCQRRISSISENWVSARRSRVEQIMNRELEASRLRDEIKEVEVRFAVGEFGQELFERRTGLLQGSLKRVEKEISDTRRYIDEMDMKMFRCSELLRESL